MNKTFKLLLVLSLVVIFALSVFAFVSCADGEQGKLEITVSKDIDIKVGDDLNSVKQYITVNYVDENGNKTVVTDYQLQGTLTEGETTLTVKYKNVTATCKITVKANTQQTQYELVFKADGVVVEMLHYTVDNIDITAPRVPEKTGYTGEWEEYSLSTGNLMVNAVYTAKTYTVLLNYDGATESNVQSSIKVTYGQVIGTLPTPTKTDCIFEGWVMDETIVNSQTIWNVDTEEQLTFKAKWTELIATEGLLLELSEDGEKYLVVGIDENSTATNIVIPSMYQDKFVTGINSYAFLNDYITSVVIPESITVIEEEAIMCKNLVRIDYLGSMEQWFNITLGEDMPSFWCDDFSSPEEINLIEFHIQGEKITDLVIPEGVIKINNFAFSIWSIESVTFPTSVKEIGGGAFYACMKLKDISFNEGLTSIGPMAFGICMSLRQIALPNGVTTIDAFAFASCVNLSSIIISSTVAEIGRHAFEECLKLFEVYNLSSLNITVGSDEHGEVALHAKYVYSSLDEPSKFVTTTTPDGYVFYCENDENYLVDYVGNETELSLPESYNGDSYKIAQGVFAYMHTMSKVTIPISVTTIDYCAFLYCSSLTEINFNGTVEQWNAIAKEYSWNGYVSATKVICTDGEVVL